MRVSDLLALSQRDVPRIEKIKKREKDGCSNGIAVGKSLIKATQREGSAGDARLIADSESSSGR